MMQKAIYLPPINHPPITTSLQSSPPSSFPSSFPSPNKLQPLNSPPKQESHARNFKTRLFNADPNEQQQKNDKIADYRRELLQQMQDQARRKLEEKRRFEEEDLKHERDFYSQRIEAQKKDAKEEPTYFVVRSSKGARNKSIQVAKQNINLMPKIQKRGGYHNQSYLDNPEQGNKTKGVVSDGNVGVNQGVASLGRVNESNISHPKNVELINWKVEQKREEQENNERMQRVIMLQEAMIRKMDNFRKEILSSSNHLQINQQIQKVRLALKAKSFHQMMASSDLSVFQRTDNFYHPPSPMNHKQIVQLTNRPRREQVRLASIDEAREEQTHRLNKREKEVLQDEEKQENKKMRQYQGKEEEMPDQGLRDSMGEDVYEGNSIE